MQTGKAISIPSILKVGNGTLNKIGEYLKSEELTSVVIGIFAARQIPGKFCIAACWHYLSRICRPMCIT